MFSYIFGRQLSVVHNCTQDISYFRPTEINELRGDASKAKKQLNWKPKTNFKDLVKEMMISDLKEIK